MEERKFSPADGLWEALHIVTDSLVGLGWFGPWHLQINPNIIAAIHDNYIMYTVLPGMNVKFSPEQP